jgi:hypothetical protein
LVIFKWRGGEEVIDDKNFNLPHNKKNENNLMYFLKEVTQKRKCDINKKKK